MIAYIKDNNYLYLDLVSTDIEDLLIREFSVFDPRARFSIAYEDGQWDGRIVSYDRKGKKLSITFLEDLKSLCQKENIPLDVVDQRPEPKYKPIPKEQLNKDILPGIKLEDHQMRCLYSIYEHDNGIHAHKTGAGKSEMMAAIISMFPHCPTAVIAEEKIVLSQLVERLQLRSITDVGEFYAGKRPDGQLIIVGSIQALSIPPGSARKAELKRTGMDKAWQTRRKNALFLQEAIKKCHLLLVDECDRSSSDSYQELFTKLAINARYRYGFSGTPFDDAKPVQNLTIRERFGNIISQSSREELEAIGRIIPVTYTMLACNENGDKRDKTDNNSAIKEWMIENVELHNKINKICQFYKDEGTLILVESLPLGEKLAEVIPGAEFIHGKTPDNKREEVITRFESRELKVLIGSKILRRGLDLKGGCENLILCYDGQMGSEFMQRLGRAVRKNKKGSSRVFDFIIMANHYLYKHARKRLEAVVTEGYKSTIVYKGIKLSGEDIIRRRWHFPKTQVKV